MFRAALKLKQLQEKLVVHLQEDLKGTSLIQSVGIGAARRARAAKAISEAESANREVAMKGAASAAAGVLLTMALTLVLWGYGGYQVLAGTLSIGTLIAFSAYIGRIDGPVRTMVASNMGMTNSRASIQRLHSLLSTVSTIESCPGSPQLRVTAGEIVFDEVSFSYDGHDDIFRDLNLVFPGGQVSAVVGKTGVGKTSLLNLIPRLYDPSSGSVTIDGQPVREVDLDSLRKSIAVVRQDTFLFNTTIRENLLLGRTDIDDEFLLETCRNVGIDADIALLPKGYDTEIAENGVNLSGGQKQRLALVRALLSNAPIILLDEFTSALDSKTERSVHPVLKSAFAGRTVIIITHNAATLELADRVFLLSRKDDATVAQLMRTEDGIAFIRQTDGEPPPPTEGARWNGDSP
jgi:subfamily B ATP-binding cassette protein MsbA